MNDLLAMGKDITLIICGPYHQNTLKNINQNKDFFSEILVSGYLEDMETWEKNQSSDFSLILNEKPVLEGINNEQNVYLQTYTTLNALLRVKTPKVVKCRTDEYFSNLYRIFGFFKKDFISSNIFVRDFDYKAFHISDHLYAGNSNSLIKTFTYLKEYLEDNDDKYLILGKNTPAEVKIAIFFLKSKGYNPIELNQLSLKKKFNIFLLNFFIFNVNLLKPYELSSSKVGQFNDYKQFIKEDCVFNFKYIRSYKKMKPAPYIFKKLFNIYFRIKKKIRCR